MSQELHVPIPGGWRSFSVPDPDVEAMPGIRWGSTEQILTPAFWHALWQFHGHKLSTDLRSGRTLAEETVACLLGGFGIKAELAAAAFERLQGGGLLDSVTPAADIEQALALPFDLFERPVRYRYPRLKSRYIAAALAHFAQHSPPDADLALREWLLAIPGVGLKIASWVVRNWAASNEVAILDIHVIRAGLAVGLFSTTQRVERDYREMEQRFLAFVAAIRIPASALDLLIWSNMRKYGWWETHGQLALASD